jgi:hypothetical protein
MMATTARAGNNAVADWRCPAAWPVTSYRDLNSASPTSPAANNAGRGHHLRTMITGHHLALAWPITSVPHALLRTSSAISVALTALRQSYRLRSYWRG